MFLIQGRVFASSPDEAAAKIRDKYNEPWGKLTVKEAFRELGWFEYMLELSWDEKI